METEPKVPSLEEQNNPDYMGSATPQEQEELRAAVADGDLQKISDLTMRFLNERGANAVDGGARGHRSESIKTVRQMPTAKQNQY